MESAVMYKLNEQNNSLISINFQLEGISDFLDIYSKKHFCHPFRNKMNLFD